MDPTLQRQPELCSMSGEGQVELGARYGWRGTTAVGAVWNRLGCSRGRALCGALGSMTLLIFLAVLGSRAARDAGRHAYEIDCPEEARVYYPPRHHWYKLTFMFCCPCCANDSQPLCYDDMMHWMGTWFKETLSHTEQIGVASHLYAALVVRGEKPRRAQLTRHEVAAWQEYLFALVPDHRDMRGMVTDETFDELMDSNESRRMEFPGDVFESNRESLARQAEFYLKYNLTLPTNETTVSLKDSGHQQMFLWNMFAPDEMSLLLSEMGFGKDAGVFKLAFSKPTLDAAVYRYMHVESMDLMGMAKVVGELTRTVEILEDEMWRRELAEDCTRDDMLFGMCAFNGTHFVGGPNRINRTGHSHHHHHSHHGNGNYTTKTTTLPSSNSSSST